MDIRITASALVLAFSTSAFAEDVAKEAQPMTSQIQEEFSVLDADSNGTITQEEVSISPDLASAFKELDSNGSGDIDMSEYVLFQSPATAAGNPTPPTDVEASPAK